MTNSDWTELTLGDLLDDGKAFIQTGPFGSQLHSYDYKPVGVPVVPTEAIGWRRLNSDGVPRISLDKADQLSRHRLKHGDILFARRGIQATGLSAIVEAKHANWICGTGAILLRLQTEEIDRVFLSFLLIDNKTRQWLQSHAVGAVMPNLNEGVLRRLPLRIPPLSEQRRIADILGKLDDKIELNRRMNKTMEAMARRLFKSWFVDFAPVHAKATLRHHHPKLSNPDLSHRALPDMDPKIAEIFPDEFEDSELGSIPMGWKMSAVENIATLEKSTVTPSSFPNEIFDHFSIPAFDNCKAPVRESGDQIKSNKFVVTAECVLLTKLNPRIPRVWLPFPSTSHRSLCSTEFLVLRPRDTVSKDFLYSLISSRSFFEIYGTMVTGTSGSHQRVKPEYLLAMRVIEPPSGLQYAFAGQVGKLHTQMERLRIEATILARTRDKLLPRLLSGELTT